VANPDFHDVRSQRGIRLQVQFRSALAQCLNSNSNAGVVADVESGVFRPMATIAVADMETDLRVIVVVAPSFRSRALRVGVVEVLAADLDKANVMAL